MKISSALTSTPLRKLIAVVGLITIVCAVVEFGLQTTARRAANDPQISLAQDVATLLTYGISADQIITEPPVVDIRESLSPWLVIYDVHGAPVASTGLLDNGVPQIPAGVFEYVEKFGEDRITWQPTPTLRQAIVVTMAKDKGFVVSGRNLREVDAANQAMLWRVMGAWLVCVGIAVVWYGRMMRRKRR